MRAAMRRALSFLLVLTACVSSSTNIPKAWMSVPETERMDLVTLADDGTVTQSALVVTSSPVRVELNRLVRDGKTITETFQAIDSFDYSRSRDEVAFSAKRDASFDIGLVAGDGSKTNWIPPDPADEIAVQWAPRGNKISYVVRAPQGDIIRTFHVPTSFQYALDFGPAVIHQVAWDPKAEHFAVVYSTPDASDRVEVMRYDGTDRRTAIAPAAQIDADLIPFAPGAFALRPRDLRYGETLTAVIWVVPDWSWNDARAALMRHARVASIVTTRGADAELERVIRATAWLDASKIFVVGGTLDGAISIIGDASVPAGRYRRHGNVVAAAPAAIQSVAAGFIADQWNASQRNR